MTEPRMPKPIEVIQLRPEREADTSGVNTDTKVNPFNGTSDESKVAEVAQKLWDAGAWNADGKPDAEQGQGAASEPVQEGAPESRPDWHGDYEAMERAEQFAETSRAQRSQELQQAMLQGQHAQQQFLAQYQNISPEQWERLRAENPQAYEQIVGQYRQIEQHLSTVQEHARELATEFIGAEKEKALRLLPQWRDPETFAAAKQDMLDYARQHGISQAEIDGITDHRHLVALYHASQAGKAQPPKPTYRVNRAQPKGPKVSPDMRPLVEARKQFMKDPRDRDTQGAYAQRLLEAGA